MKIAAVMDDLLLLSRIDAAASRGDASLVRVSSPESVPADSDLVLVDWAQREPSWESELRRRRAAGTRVILFGPHTDLDAHEAARSADLGPMWARSKLIAKLPGVVRGT